VSGLDIWVLPLSGDRKPHPFLNGTFDEFDPRLSPDGRYLAYVSNESGRDEVYVQTYPDRSDKWQVSTHGGSDPHWTAGGHEIDYLSLDQHMMAVAIRSSPSFDPGTPQSLFATKVLFPGNQRAHYDVSADGRSFVMFVQTLQQALPTTTVVVNWTSEIAKR